MFLLGASAVLAILVLPLRGRPRLSAVLVSVASAQLGAFALLASLDEPFRVLGMSFRLDSSFTLLGRSLILDSANRSQIGFLYLSGAFLLGASWITPSGRRLPSLGLLVVTAVAASLMIRPFLFSSIFLEIAAMGCVLLLVTPPHMASRGAARLLMLYTLAVPALLLSGWMVESLGVTTETPASARSVSLLLALGFGILMIVPPFHFWLPTTAERAGSYPLAFVVIVLQSAGLFFLLRFIDTYTWFREEAQLFEALRWIGAGMAMFGSLAALVQTSLSRAAFYGILGDFAIALIALSQGRTEGYQLALALSGGRVVSVALWSLGLDLLREQAGGDSFGSLSGVGRKMRWVSWSVSAGLLSMVGFPLLAGFPTRWGILVTSLAVDTVSRMSVVFSVLLGAIMVFRWISVLLARTSSGPEVRLAPAPRFFLATGIVMVVAIGIFPQILFPWVVEALAGMSNLVP
jgi:formate hydrogenlyase subunit 3/multisubunit Na+/H+ antiporter MnhD subunit